MLPPHRPQNNKARAVKFAARKPAPRLPEVTSPLDRLAVKNIRLRLRRRITPLKPSLRVLGQAEALAAR
ncbi:MAG: hypothetical protein ACOYLQ_03990 [Hyphomicrobiaceae bacterium]